MTPPTYRQGDVLFKRVQEDDIMPAGLIEQTSPILVEGEVTGHAHRVDTMHAVNLMRPNWRPYYRVTPLPPDAPPRVHVLAGPEGQLYLHVVALIQIIHEEHRRIVLAPGYYQVARQREYVAPELSRTVVD